MGATVAKLSYAEALEKVLDRLDEAAISPGGGAALLARLDGIDKRGEETVDLLNRLNGHVREHGQQLAAHGEWMKSHQSIHKGMDTRLDRLSNKINVVAAINTTLSFIAGVLGLSPSN